MFCFNGGMIDKLFNNVINTRHKARITEEQTIKIEENISCLTLEAHLSGCNSHGECNTPENIQQILFDRWSKGVDIDIHTL